MVIDGKTVKVEFDYELGFDTPEKVAGELLEALDLEPENLQLIVCVLNKQIESRKQVPAGKCKYNDIPISMCDSPGLINQTPNHIKSNPRIRYQQSEFPSSESECDSPGLILASKMGG